MKISDVINIAQDLVRIPSVNPYYDINSVGEKDVAEWIENWGRKQNFETLIQPALEGRSNIVIHFRNGSEHPHFLFNGHMDTVGVAGMTINPFGGEISRGRLWGRGAADMKGALACMLTALLRLKENASSWRGTVSVGCVIDEEHCFRGILALLEQIGCPDYALVGEPTSMQVVRGCKGCLRFAMHAKGKAAHSSNPFQGISAIVAMSHAILELESFFQNYLIKIKHPGFGTSTGSIGLIEGGTGVNIVPEHCTIQVDVRLLPGQDGQKTYEEIQTYVRTRCNQVKGVEWSFDDPFLIDNAFEISSKHLLVQEACAIANSEKSEVVPYGCDASKIAARGIPCVIMGPGNITFAHTADESIGVIELEEATNQYVQLIMRLCQ